MRVLSDFFSSWDLFHNTYLASWLVASVLALTGFYIIARNQIFFGAAIAQTSTLGIAVGLAFGSWFPSSSPLYFAFLAVFFSILAAFIMSFGGHRGRESFEAITGWLFLFSSSMAILVVSHSPHGLEEIHRLLSSSIIGATRNDVYVFAALLIFSICFIARLHQAFILFVIDPEMAASVGLRIRIWNVLSAIWLGLVIGLAIRVSGMLFTFGCLVLPGLCAKYFCRELKPLFLWAPLLALGVAILGSLFAHHWDFPPAQMSVGLLSGLFVFLWLVKYFTRSLSRSA